MQVAVVDYQAADAPETFTESLRSTGFAVVVNHPLRQELVEAIYAEWLAFFDGDDKWNYPANPDDQNGYFAPSVSETAKGNTIKDIKEFFHYYPWGRYPSTVSDAAKQFRDEATDVARTMLGWVEANTPDHVAQHFSMPPSNMLDGSTRTLLRILRYPPLRGDEPAGAVRAAAHEDINLLTVLPASNEPGLQVRDLAGNWHDVPCDFGSIAINAGDMLQLASGGYYPSTTHRVINPIGESAKRSRISMPLFLHPADNVPLAPDRTAFEYLTERIQELRGQAPRA
jgi:isopenicillin N synthase-like dioxygenase